ncbi:hypothetical protein ECG_02132 [Echinococcus granulosus]|uniref:Zinc finger C2H2 n=1 Tax=Echinococcus granulosus TaxID=6210 RepID=A0A068WPZ5_ECHGR|nr:hypothetical protein ECG_02132 [Echinococcus granulosus]CDS21832.1 Zinc finger C2H2 [Echinococcus granulosus]
MESCLFCKKPFSENGELWNHLTSGTCSGAQTAGSVQSSTALDAPFDDFGNTGTVPTYSDLAAESLLVKNDSKDSPDGSSNACKQFTQPPSPPDAPPNSVLLKSTSKEFDHVFRDPLMGNSSLLGMNGNSATSAHVTPRTNENKVVAGPSLPPATPPFPGPRVSAPADYARSLNSSAKKDFPCELASSQLGSEASATDSQHSKWKCTLCNIEFIDKAAMFNHVKSQEHEANIQVVKGAARDAPLNALSGSILQKSSVPTDFNLASKSLLVKNDSKDSLNGSFVASKYETSTTAKKDFLCEPASSQLGAEASATDSQHSKWKCTLCNIEFIDKAAMFNHVKSQEHEAKIQVVKGAAGDAPLSALPRRQSTSPGSLPKSELVETIRQVVLEELPALLRSELRRIFNAAFMEPSKEIVPSRSASSNSLPEVDADAQYILTQGISTKCSLCDCPITSAANMKIHVEGKKHKANLAKLENPRGNLRISSFCSVTIFERRSVAVDSQYLCV